MDASQQHQAWRFASWLALYPLDAYSVLDYFKHSPFYDRSCNNELLELQSAGLDPQQRMQQLHSMTGLEFELDLTTQYLIRKQIRRSPSEVSILAVYYVLGAPGPNIGTVYSLPSVHAVLSSQLCSATYYLEQALDQLSKVIQFNPVQFYSWKRTSVSQEAEEENLSTEDQEGEDAPHKYSRLVDEILRISATNFQSL
jgi:mediator of RNA polymerase II transcription subunit 6